MPFTPAGLTAYSIEGSTKREAMIRDLRPMAKLLSEAMAMSAVDVADEREVEQFLRTVYPIDSQKEVDLLVEMCPDMVRAIRAVQFEKEGIL
jgi:ABC-type iron transport system FetAB ATPase subunit